MSKGTRPYPPLYMSRAVSQRAGVATVVVGGGGGFDYFSPSIFEKFVSKNTSYFGVFQKVFGVRTGTQFGCLEGVVDTIGGRGGRGDLAAAVGSGRREQP